MFFRARDEMGRLFFNNSFSSYLYYSNNARGFSTTNGEVLLQMDNSFFNGDGIN